MDQGTGTEVRPNAPSPVTLEQSCGKAPTAERRPSALVQNPSRGMGETPDGLAPAGVGRQRWN